MTTVLIIILVLLAIGAFGSYPAWGHSANWGYAPFGGLLGLILVIVLVVWLLGGVRI